MTSTEHWMKELEDRDYSDVEEDRQNLHLIIMRDRLAYYSLQLRPFFFQDPWDLPVVVDGRTYRPADLMSLQMGRMSVVEFFALLTDIEVALIEAAGRRGICLVNRGKVDQVSGSAPASQRMRGENGRTMSDTTLSLL